jgi:hypothetical protein
MRRFRQVTTGKTRARSGIFQPRGLRAPCFYRHRVCSHQYINPAILFSARSVMVGWTTFGSTPRVLAKRQASGTTDARFLCLSPTIFAAVA